MVSVVKGGMSPAGVLDGITSVLAVVAHPDDESFGLGGVVEHLAAAGAPATVLCFTHGEASTLHGAETDLGRVRPAEFQRAAEALGVGRAELLDFPDGALSAIPLPDLVSEVTRLAQAIRPSHLLAFDVSGVTGHPDHQRATAAALAAADALSLPVLMWALPRAVAAALNREFGAAFAGRPPVDLSRLTVRRSRQWDAIACHASQSADNPVLRRRLELLGDSEHLLLRPSGAGA